MNNSYKELVLQDLVDMVKNNPTIFKDGMKTKILSGDFEGNYTHIKHELMIDTFKRKKVIFIGYEMNENFGE